MSAPSRRMLIITGVLASVITLISIVGNLMVVRHPSPGLRPAIFAALLSFPGALLAVPLAIGHGPEGMPTEEDVLPYVFNLLLWWGFLYLLGGWLARRRARDHP